MQGADLRFWTYRARIFSSSVMPAIDSTSTISLTSSADLLSCCWCRCCWKPPQTKNYADYRIFYQEAVIELNHGIMSMPLWFTHLQLMVRYKSALPDWMTHDELTDRQSSKWKHFTTHMDIHKLKPDRWHHYQIVCTKYNIRKADGTAV